MVRYDEFAGRTALLAGGATLIGRELAKAFVAQGANVVIADIDAEGGAVAARESGALLVETDVTNDAALARCIATAKREFETIDFLVNVTTTYLDDGIDTSRQEWLKALDVGLVGAAMLAQMLRGELAANKGAIVNFSSISAHRAQAGRFVYPAIKAAMAQLTRSQALEFAPLGVRVNAITPGWTWSNVMDAITGGDRPKVDQVGGAFHMPGRIADAAELAGAILFLCSDQAAFVAGTELVVDGGYLALGPERADNAIAALLSK